MVAGVLVLCWQDGSLGAEGIRRGGRVERAPRRASSDLLVRAAAPVGRARPGDRSAEIAAGPSKPLTRL